MNWKVFFFKNVIFFLSDIFNNFLVIVFYRGVGLFFWEFFFRRLWGVD